MIHTVSETKLTQALIYQRVTSQSIYSYPSTTVITHEVAHYSPGSLSLHTAVSSMVALIYQRVTSESIYSYPSTTVITHEVSPDSLSLHTAVSSMVALIYQRVTSYHPYRIMHHPETRFEPAICRRQKRTLYHCASQS